MPVHCTHCPPANQPVTTLNRDCYCISLDGAAFQDALATEVDGDELLRLIEERRPNLFSARPIFLSASQTERMANVIRAIEYVIAMPAYRATVLAGAPGIARHAPLGATGVSFGYDIHVHDNGIGLIEINTNAGGAMLNAVLPRRSGLVVIQWTK